MSLYVRGDSYVLESAIHFPTDLSILWDSSRKVVDCLLSLGFELSGHRQLFSLRKKIRSVYLKSSDIHRKKGKNYQSRLQAWVKEYLLKAGDLLLKSKSSYSRLVFEMESGIYKDQAGIVKKINNLGIYIGYLEQFIDLVNRRILQGEKIPHSEKIFSIFEPEVEWISKGKSGKAVEFGHRHLIYTDQYQFILHHQVMVNQTDKEVGLSAGKQVVLNYGKQTYEFASLSYDRGFYSGPSKAGLKEFYGQVIMPKSGKKTASEQLEEESESFIEKKHHHSGVEGNINSLEHTGLDKCPDRGLQRFKNYAALGVLAYNLRQLGKWITKMEKEESSQLGASHRRVNRAA